MTFRRQAAPRRPGPVSAPPPMPPPEGEEARAPAYELFWRALRPVFSWIAALLIVCGIVLFAVNWVQDSFFSPVDEQDSASIVFEIPRGSSVSGIGRMLVEADLIRNKGVFQYYAEFLGMGGKLKAGTYELSRNMTVKEIINEISMGDGGQQTMTFQVIEGMNIEEMAQHLVETNVLRETRVFLELCRTGEAFAEDYDFIQAVIDREETDRRYVLEGYLFPDTYDIYVGSDEQTIIRKMLDRMREIYNVNFLLAAEEAGVSMDEALTLASIIEKEAKAEDFDKVSAVFHNRIDDDMRLESCVTVQYALKMKRLVLTAEDLSVPSPYNTYQNDGLPIGPVASPSRRAMQAALSPDEEFMDEGYLYFCSTDPETGILQFSKTLSDHEAASEEYRPLWQAFDDKNKGETP